MLNKLFFNTKMTYKRVIIFAIVVAIFSALMLILPFTIHTSLSNPGTYLESWILFALIIIMNSDKPLEAGIKTLLFFGISQPLIYLLQVPFSSLGWQLFMFYPRWGIISLLTFPGAMIAWYIKKDSVLSAIILSVATSFLVFQGIYFMCECLNFPPHNLLSFIYCFVLVFVFILTLLKKKTNRIVAFSITGIALLVSIWAQVFLMGFAF